MSSYSILSYLDPYKPSTASMNGAPLLTFATAPVAFQNLGYENQAVYYESGNNAILRALFKINLKEGADYYIYSSSYFDPFLLSLHDVNGSFIAVDSGTTYGNDSLTYKAPYTGAYYINASWDQGSASTNKFVYLSISEDVTPAVVTPPPVPVPVNKIPTISGIPLAAKSVFVGEPSDLVDFTVADADGDTLMVTLVANRGTIIGLVDADPNKPGIQVVGAAATVNAALASAKFTANFEGAASIDIAVSDGKIDTPVNAAYTFTATQTLDLNVVGTAGVDVLFGGRGNDKLNGLGSGDVLNGGDGIDIAIYAGNKSNYTVKVSPVFALMSDVEGTDILYGIERLSFADGKVAYDLNGNAGAAALIIGTVVGKAALKNKELVGNILALLDSGATVLSLSETIVSSGVIASLAGGSDNASFVKLLMRNVLGTDSDSAVVNSLSSALDLGFSTKSSMLATASQLDATKLQIDLIGLSAAGIEYI